MHPALLASILLVISAAAIYLACEYFVNGVEWVGRKLAVSQRATGSILAAFGTALPESVITFIAVVFGTSAAHKSLGVGAALGGPLVLSTIAYGVVGLTLLLAHQRLPHGTPARAQFAHLSRDQGWFMGVFVVKLALGLVAFAWKPWLGALFLVAYAAYFRMEMRADELHAAEAELEPLKLMPRRAVPAAWAAVAQTLVALAVIFGASQLFVEQLAVLGPVLGIHPQLLALLLAPVATELPETLNAVIWVRQGKHQLALANISGSMMIQATVPTALGLFFTPWLFDNALILSAFITLLAIAILLWAFRHGKASPALLASMSLLYVLFGVLLVALHLG